MKLHLAHAPTTKVSSAEKETKTRVIYKLVPPRSSARNVLFVWRKIAGTCEQLEVMCYPVSVPSGTPVTNVGL